MTKENFLKGAAILGIAGVLVKIIGSVYRITLLYILTDIGMGYYQTVYPLYNLLLAISTAGFPVAVAKLVAEKRALGDYKGAHRLFKITFFGFLFAGITTSLFVLLRANYLSHLFKNKDAYYSFIAISPALMFVPIMSAFRGYFQGRQTMVPTAVSQLTEQLFRVVIGLVLAYQFLERGLPLAAGGATFGASAGALAGTIVIMIIYLSQRRYIKQEIKNSADYPLESLNSVIKKVLLIAIPITIGAAIVPIMNSIDVAIVMRRLQMIGFTETEANGLYGRLAGMAQTLINLPQVLSTALAMSLVPAVSAAFARKNYTRITRITRSGIRIMLLIGLPAALGLYILSTPIIELVYFASKPEVQQSAGSILAILSFSLIFLTLVQSLTAIMQGLGKPMIPVKNLAIGAVVKVILTYILTGIPEIGVKGAALSTVVAYLVAAVLNFMAVMKYTKTSLNFVNIFLKPIISVILMVVFVKFSYVFLSSIINSKIATIISIVIGALVYGSALLATGAITSRDFELLPGGKKISKVLGAIGILRE
ncbi:stage V sporulation protein B [Caloranaerobacter azorensis DSM 13643]|uniref:Stage V sporulation protein B n=1 Tax=Caloranaerobacter azorensis DSM 13643 TaxID=1121264 RepID=A0A1M5SWB5_9FIRM|nr:polysaccharide biosynthesis protein [Caloranaerobacter azorensis]SHH42794.1 stage V sporulation protein B [Caloranaerobacter azorensis DSM 13643]